MRKFFITPFGIVVLNIRRHYEPRLGSVDYYSVCEIVLRIASYLRTRKGCFAENGPWERAWGEEALPLCLVLWCGNPGKWKWMSCALTGIITETAKKGTSHERGPGSRRTSAAPTDMHARLPIFKPKLLPHITPEIDK